MKKLIDYCPKTKNILEENKKLNRKEKIISAIRNVYSVNDELAILRQRDTKPEEFKEYFEFVENIKNNLKEEEKEVN